MKRMSFKDYLDAKNDDDWRLIDVRESDEWEAVHVEEAELFPLSKIRQGELPEEDERPIAIICRSGGRSAMACQIFERAGFAECTNIEGGTNAAIEAGEDYVVRG